MIDNGSEVAKLATDLRGLLEQLGETGTSLLDAPPPAGGGPWATSRAMLLSVPPVVTEG